MENIQWGGKNNLYNGNIPSCKNNNSRLRKDRIIIEKKHDSILKKLSIHTFNNKMGRIREERFFSAFHLTAVHSTIRDLDLTESQSTRVPNLVVCPGSTHQITVVEPFNTRSMSCRFTVHQQTGIL